MILGDVHGGRLVVASAESRAKTAGVGTRVWEGGRNLKIGKTLRAQMAMCGTCTRLRTQS